MSLSETTPDLNHDFTSVQENGKPICVPATEYSTAWACQWTDPEFGIFTKTALELLKHVNCSYLSSGKPPTMLALKQHAQSLTILISKLSASDTFGVVDGKGKRKAVFQKNDAFDWLNNLAEPYTNDDEFHHMPLYALANQVEKEDEETGIKCHCPLEAARNWGPLEPGEKLHRPYLTHHNLVMHANECLEILDHEYSATGGLTSLLPSGNEADSEEMLGVKNTILGQLLLREQHMAVRMHELEINYAQALDILAGESVIPMQLLHHSGAEGRVKEFDQLHQQDRYILANAGNDVFDHVHSLMDKIEAKMGIQDKVSLESGVSGERLWSQVKGTEWYSRGHVSVDLITRFTRLKGQGRGSTIFIIPAIEHHPGTAETQKIEKLPTVVSVVAPYWPERWSDLEQRFNHYLKKTEELEEENQKLSQENMEMKDQLEIVLRDHHKTQRDVEFYEGTILPQYGQMKTDLEFQSYYNRLLAKD